jgi:hypothetical protein
VLQVVVEQVIVGALQEAVRLLSGRVAITSMVTPLARRQVKLRAS